MPKKLLIIAGGGTGGHVLAGIAIAEQWKLQLGGEVLFVGAHGGIEEKLVPRSGLELELLSLGSLKGVSLKKKLTTLFQLPVALAQSLKIVIQRHPSAVIGVGGFASGPLVLVARLLAWRWKAKVAILEQNAVPGFTNRILSQVAHEIYSAFPGKNIEEQFKGRKFFVTGNPVRAQMLPLSPSIPPTVSRPFTLFIFGGSQGALGMNSLVIDALPVLAQSGTKFRFIHQTGERDYDRVLAAHQKNGTDAQVEKFIYEMPKCYAVANLVICRAGSSTLAELAAVGRASILVPFPFASDNHQDKNARVFENQGAANVLVQSESTGKDLAQIILELSSDIRRVKNMEDQARTFYRPNAALDVVKHLSE